MFSSAIIQLVSKLSPFLGTALGGPAGALVGSLISRALGGVNMENHNELLQSFQDPAQIAKLKELEMQLQDLQNARDYANKEQGLSKLIRPILAIIAMFAIILDIYAIELIESEVVKEVLVIMLVILVYDIRQIYNFYFGSSDELPNLSLLTKRKK